MGPILFTIFINDLPDCVQSCFFADDTNIYDSTDNAGSGRIQEDIIRLQRWSDLWNLCFSITKCQILHIGKNNQEIDYKMKLSEDNYDNIAKCEEEKDLGVIFDKYLSFDAHIHNSINKANSMIGIRIVRRTLTFIDGNIFTNLYKSLVRPHLEYGNIVWFPQLKKTVSCHQESS